MGAHTRARGMDSLSKDKTGKARSPKETTKTQAAPGKKRRGSDIGRALRSVYDQTLREEVPDDFDDLLRKLS